MRGSVSKRCTCPVEVNPKTGRKINCKRPHGSWSFLVDVGRDPVTGKRHQERGSGFRTEAAARRALAKVVASTSRASTGRGAGNTFESYADAWLDDRARRVRPVTADAYRSILKHATAAFGSKAVGDLAAADVERVVARLADSGRSRRTASLFLFTVRSVLDRAQRETAVQTNIAQHVQPEGRPAVERKALTDAELGRVRAVVDTRPDAALWHVSLFGARRSEVLGLQWGDIASGTVSVERGVTASSASGGRRNAPTPTKTRRGTRVLPLPAETVEASDVSVSSRRGRSVSRRSGRRRGSRSTAPGCRCGPRRGRTCGTRSLARRV